jgi:hypothetical protein
MPNKRLLPVALGLAIYSLIAVMTPIRSSAASRAELTVLIYVAHDNDLDDFFLGALKEILDNPLRDVNYVVFIDRSRATSTAASADLAEAADFPGLGDFSGAKVFAITSKGIGDIVDLGEVYSLSPQTLAWFVQYGLTKYPAKRSIMTFSDHGGGPLALFGQFEDDTPSDDPRAQPPFLIPSWKAAMRSGLESAYAKGWRGHAGRPRLDAVVWDTCLNATLEVARATSPFAKYMLASEEITMGSLYEGSWDLDYRRAISPQGRDGTTYVVEFLKSLTLSTVSVYGAGAAEQRSDDYTQSIYDLDKIAVVDQALAQFVRTIKDTNQYSALIEARSSGVLEFGRLSNVLGQTWYEYRRLFPYVDLGDLLARIPQTASPRVLAARNALYAANESARIWLENGRENAAARGLSIYYPLGRQWLEPSYGIQTDPTNWLSVLRQAQAGDPSEIGVQTSELSSTSAGWKATVTLKSPVPNGITASMYSGELSEQGLQARVVVPATLRAGGPNNVQAAMSWHYFTFGSSAATMYLNIQNKTIGFEAIRTSASGGRPTLVWVESSIHLKSGVWNIGSPRIFDSGGTAVTTPTAGDTIVPRLSTYRVMPNSDGKPHYTQIGYVAQPGLPANSPILAVPISTGTPWTIDVLVESQNNGQLLARETLQARR